MNYSIYCTKLIPTSHSFNNFLFGNFFRGLLQFFYIYDPAETAYEHYDQVPSFYRNAWPHFLVFLCLENLILFWQKKTTFRLNDGITSLSLGLMQECGRLLFRGSENAAYIYIYNNYRLVNIPWNSLFTWYLAFLSVDFCYYWVHRASHEIGIFWAQHQVHHSSEEFNLAVGVRQSVLQGWCSFIFYLPMAFFMPPSHFISHQQFNLLYQVWIHTKTVKTLGPLEYIFNTPQHHRVHHGCNNYCLDKNYGGVLIIWDRLFQTFAAEKEKEELVYGLVLYDPSFNPLFLQTFYNKYLFQKAASMTGIKNKFFSLLKGPSWEPGSPWTGNEKDKADIKFRAVYDVKITFLCNLYVSIHFVIVSLVFYHFVITYMSLSSLTVLLYTLYTITTLTTIGMILENHPKAVTAEFFRCLILLGYTVFSKQKFTNNSLFVISTQLFFCASVLFCVLHRLNILKIKTEK